MEEYIKSGLEQFPEIANYLKWGKISREFNLSTEFMYCYDEYLNFDEICKYQKLDIDFIEDHKLRINFDILSENKNLDKKIFMKYIYKMNWDKIQENQKIPEAILLENYSSLNIPVILQNQEVSEDFCKKNIEHLDLIFRFQKVSEEFIIEYFDEMFALNIIENQNISFEFLMKILKINMIPTCMKFQKLNFDQIEQIIFQIPGSLTNVIAYAPKLSCEDVKTIIYKYNLSEKNAIDMLRHNIDQEIFEFLNLLIVKKEYNNLYKRVIYGELNLDIINYVKWDTLHEIIYKLEDFQALGDNIHKMNIYQIIVYRNHDEKIINYFESIGVMNSILWWYVLNLRELYLSSLFKYKNSEKSKFWKNEKDLLVPYFPEFLGIFVKYANWKKILETEELSEFIIDVFKNFSSEIDMFWWRICKYQKISEEYMKTNLYVLDLATCLQYQKDLSKEFLTELYPFLDENCKEKALQFHNFSM